MLSTARAKTETAVRPERFPPPSGPALLRRGQRQQAQERAGEPRPYSCNSYGEPLLQLQANTCGQVLSAVDCSDAPKWTAVHTAAAAEQPDAGAFKLQVEQQPPGGAGQTAASFCAGYQAAMPKHGPSPAPSPPPPPPPPPPTPPPPGLEWTDPNAYYVNRSLQVSRVAYSCSPCRVAYSCNPFGGSLLRLYANRGAAARQSAGGGRSVRLLARLRHQRDEM